jgi:hypothetical protein
MEIDFNLFDTSEKLIDLAVERSHKFYVIKLKAVIKKLLQFENDQYFQCSQQNFLIHLSELKATEILNYGTDFFWLSVHRLYNAFDATDKKVIEIMYSFFLQNAFDSYFQLIPNGSRIQFENFGDGPVMFVKLNICVNSYFDRYIILRKEHNHKIEYSLDGEFVGIHDRQCSIDLKNAPSYFQIAKALIADKITILYQRQQNIFELIYFAECTENPFLGNLFKERIRGALNWIKTTDANTYNSLISGLDYIVPLGNNLDGNPLSFASAQLKRTVFLSLDLLRESDIEIAETLIHEFSHCELHYIQDTILLTKKEDTNKVYYSPWRLEPRPILGLIHAIYVSYRILNYYDNLLNNKNCESDISHIVSNKMVLLINQIQIGIKQIKADSLPVLSSSLLNHISTFNDKLAQKLNINLSNPPNVILKHQELWILNNKVLVLKL